MHLILAVMWFLFAGFLFLHDRGQPGRFLPVPLSGVALVLALFNLIRWWTFRSARARAGYYESHPHRPPLRRASDEVTKPDPEFDFTDRPSEGQEIKEGPEKK